MRQLWPIRSPCTSAGCGCVYALVLLVASALGSLILTALVSDLAVSLPSDRPNPGHELSRVEQVIALNAQKYFYPPAASDITPAVEDVPVAEIWAQAHRLDIAEQADVPADQPRPTSLALSAPKPVTQPLRVDPIERALANAGDTSAPSEAAALVVAATPPQTSQHVPDAEPKKARPVQKALPALAHNPGKTRAKRVQVARATEQPRKIVAVVKLRKADRVQMFSNVGLARSRPKEPVTGDIVRLTFAGQWPRS